jgi:putative ABC transport system permease protein
MLKNSLLVSWRKLLRNKVYAVINILGLSIGIGACLIIWLVAHHEFTFDKFQADADRIYRVVTYQEYTVDTPPELVPAVVPPLPATMLSEVSGLEACAAYHTLGEIKVEVPGTIATTPIQSNTAIISGAEYFRIMRYTWLCGRASTALSQPNTAVLSEKKAKLYFGNLSPDAVIGKELIYDDSIRVSVTGVVRDWSQNTDFPYTEFISMPTVNVGYLRQELQLDHWKGTPVSSRVLVKLKPQTVPSNVQSALNTLFEKNWKSQLMIRSELQPLSEVHFAESGESTTSSVTRLSTLYTLLAISLFILLLAVVNYVNLSTAQSISRNKEIGIRKIMGSGKARLIIQFLSETFLLSLAAIVVVCATVGPVLTVFHEFIPDGVRFNPFNTDTVYFISGIVLLTTLVAGGYPAWSLSNSNMSHTIRNSFASTGKAKSGSRKALIVFQFSISLVFIISSILIGRQIHYMLTSDPGFSSDAVIEFSTNDRSHMDRVKLLQARIGELTEVEAAARENIPPMGMDRAYTGIEFKQASDAPIQVAAIKADENFVPLYGIEIVAGQNLRSSDTLKEILINQSLSKLLGFQSPDQAVGQTVGIWNRKVPIAGVVADFHQADFHQHILPQVIMGIQCADIAVKLNTKGKSAADLKLAISLIESEWKKLYPREPFEYRFLDDRLSSLYKKEQTTSWLLDIATGIAIFISCIGLFGLTLYSVEQRTREIGIRKVFGASATEIVSLIVKDFLVLVLMAFFIASPFAWYLMQQWLQNFAYRIPMSCWVFIVGGISAAGIAMLTVSWLSVKAALANPIKSLKSE